MKYIFYMHACMLITQLCLTLLSHELPPGDSLSMGFSRQEYWTFCYLSYVYFFFLRFYELLLFSHSVVSNSLLPMDCSMPCFPVLHYLLEFAQTHIHWVSDAIQLSHLSPPSVLALELSSIRVFSNESTLCIRWPKYWSFSFSPSNEYSGLIYFRID